MAFTSEVKREMIFRSTLDPSDPKSLERAQKRSELTGKYYPEMIKENKGFYVKGGELPYVCSHFCHSPKNIEFNFPSMGVYVDLIEHLAYHLMFKDCTEEIGLSLENNRFAISGLWVEINLINSHFNIRWTKEEILEKIEKAKAYWFYFLGFDPKEKEFVPSDSKRLAREELIAKYPDTRFDEYDPDPNDFDPESYQDDLAFYLKLKQDKKKVKTDFES